MEHGCDRPVEGLGNVVGLEHVNVQVPDQQAATAFYVTGLGLTRDPYLKTGLDNMWINVGRSQFHLPTGKPQVVRGHTGIVLPSREALLRRLRTVRDYLAGSRFDVREQHTHVEVTSPWGNRLRCYEPDARFGRITLGIPYVELEVAPGSADGIARFYRQVLGAPAAVAGDEGGRHARVSVGTGQELVFRETDGPRPPFDGHHIQIYVADFSGPYRRLIEKGLVSEESDGRQYRFQEIVDPDGGEALFTIEHEVRSLQHPLYQRPLVNRNPEQTSDAYAPGHDSWA
jgi:catechol 2,3-dioxygenase-like lactoylglutathione lyase family enzyme